MNIHDAAFIMHGVFNPDAAEDTRVQQEEELCRWRQQQECEEREQQEERGNVRPQIGRNHIFAKAAP
jgi:hypothetical protein